MSTPTSKPPIVPRSPAGKIWVAERFSIYWRDSKFRRGAYWSGLVAGAQSLHAMLDRHTALIVYYLPFWGVIAFFVVMGVVACGREILEVKKKGPEDTE